jgi:triosephosphate isomerase
VVSGTEVKLGAQNMHQADHGAYTGEVSGGMLRAVGCTYVILGHSERRQYFCETDESVNQKIKAALGFGLVPIVCVGESLEEREQDLQRDVVQRQLDVGFSGIEPDKLVPVIAYEPVWAIGTGQTATPEQAQDMHGFIRSWLADRFGVDTAATFEILYGGSMKPGNAHDLLHQKDIDGGLIGGASLKADDFVEIVRAALDVAAS